jgi:uncharacterized protein YjbI with pentapeptide repeats
VVVVEVNGYKIEPEANLREANLSGANLVGAFLVGADLSGANLDGAKAAEDTIWPEGFDLRAAGVIFP